MNWLGQMIGLPNEFLHLKHDSPGGGVIQVLKITHLINRLIVNNNNNNSHEIFNRLRQAKLH